MKKILLVLIIWIGISIGSISKVSAENFTDIAGHKYSSSIQFLSDRGIVQGYGDGKFWPDNTVTRAELLKIVLESSTGFEESRLNCFTDVEPDTRPAKYACYAKLKGILDGYSDNTFKPNQTITVSESLKVTLNTFNKGGGDPGAGNWYDPYFDFVHNNNIFSKYALRANVPMTRGMMAYLVHQLILEQEGKRTFDNVRDVESIGCNLPTPSVAPTETNVNGVTRHFITDVGKNYDPSKPTRLIIAFHGRTNPNTMVRTYYKIQQASQGNAIIVYPAWLPEWGPSRSRSAGGDKSDNLRDFALFDKIVEDISAQYCINKDQIYAVGHSLWAWFSNSLACARGDVLRAIGTVGGGTTINNCNGPTAAIIMHNPDDTLSTFKSGLTARDQLLKQNSCGPETVKVGPALGNCEMYTQCQTGAPVIWCPHSDSYEGKTYYTHTRPDFAGQEIRNFFTSLD